MSEADILDALRQIAQDKLKVDRPLNGDLANHLDSIQRLTLVVAIEDHFKICFDEADETEIRSLNDLVHMISTKLDQA